MPTSALVSLAAGVALPFLAELVALLVLSVLIAYGCYRLHLLPIVGFLVAGAVIGPNALGVVQDADLVNQLAEIGVILLLFTIGVEFSLTKLSRIGRFIFGGGGLQVGITLVLVAVPLWLLGVGPGESIFTGFLVALSSTAIVLTLLADRQTTDTPTGQLSLAVLIFQDLAIVAMVLLLPILSGQGGSLASTLGALGLAVLIIAAVLLLARRAVPWLLEQVARTRRGELFLLTVVALCFGTAYLTSLAGVSLALGAFLAGLVVSESRYSSQALSEVLPLRTLFNAVFFVSVGMLLDLSFLAQNLLLVLAAAAAVLVVKATVTTGSVLALGYPVRIAGAVGLTLAQIGEFSFVLERAGASVGLSPAGLGEVGSQAFIAVTVLLMVLTPPMMTVGPRLGSRLSRTALGRLGRVDEGPAAADPHAALEDHVVIAGYGPAGQRLAHVLREAGLPHVVVEMNPLTAEGEAPESPVVLGDATRPFILEHAGIHRAKLCVVAINDPAATERIVAQAHYLNPTLQIIVRARFLSDIEPLQKAGADVVVPEELEAAVRLFTHVLQAYMIPRSEIERHVNELRAGDYKVLRGSIQEAHLMVLQGLDEEGLHTRAVAVRAGAPAEGKTLAELALRNKHHLTVLAVRRAGRTIGNPAGDFRIQQGDRLVLVGTADQFVACAPLFREPRPELEG